jgi:hypothetical protein
MAQMDPLFLRKVPYALDIRIQEFPRSCMEARSRMEVEDGFLISSSFLTSIVLQNFNIVLEWHSQTRP